MNGGTIELEGLDRVLANFERITPEVAAAATKGLSRGGMYIIADAQRNLRTAGHNGGTVNNTGQLSNSGRTQVLDNGEVECGFFSKSGEGYAAYVEYGTRAHWPPVAPLRAWTRKKLRVSEDRVKSVAFLVARKIARRGTSPHPFFQPAVEKNKKRVVDAVNEAVAAVTSKDMR